MNIWLLVATVIIANVAKSDIEFVCERGYSTFKGSGYCFRLFTSPLSKYRDALEFCQDQGANLASIHNAFEDTLIKSIGADKALIGLQYSESEDAYKWSDGTPLDYRNYVDGFVENKDYLGYCAAFQNGKWVNADCDTDFLTFVCKKPAVLVNYTATPTNACPNMSTWYKDGGMLLSPGYPNRYVAGLHCVYKIAARLGYTIRMVLDDLDMGRTDVFHADWFQLQTDYADDYSGRIIAFHRTDANGYEVSLPVSSVYLIFYSMFSGTWRISWTEQKEIFSGRSNAGVAYAITSHKNEYLHCPYGYTLTDDRCYLLVSNTKLSYHDALAFCREDGGDLVSIHSKLVESFLEGFTAAIGDVLIGLADVGSGIYTWSDGTPLDYTNYDDDFATMSDYLGYCAKLKDKKWHNLKCSVELNFICERKATNFTSSPNNACPPANTVYRDSGVLLSPGYPEKYASNLPKCLYELEVGKNYFIKMVMEESDFPSNECLDMYYYSNGQWVGSAIISAFTYSQGSSWTVPYNHLLLKFNNGPASGRWRLSWTRTPKP